MADTLASWLMSPNMIASAYSNAGVGLPKSPILSFARLFKVTKSTPTSSVVVATLNDGDRNALDHLLAGTTKTMTDEFATLQNDGSISKDLTLSIAGPTIIENNRNIPVSVAVAAIVGIILGIVITLFVESFASRR
jgi:hypothetical protein